MTVASIANPAVKLKPQVYIAKGYSPWYYKNWKDASHVVTTDESESGKATVTCDGNITNMSQMFYCTHITSLDVSNFDTSNVNNMSCMFEECHNITTLDVSKFNTSNVTNMSYMFNDCSKLTSLDVSKFDTSNVTDMATMFSGCSNLTSLDLSSFNTSKVRNMDSMFFYCSKLTSVDISNFDTSKVIDMSTMFYNCSNLTTIKGVIDMKSCEYYGNMFTNCNKLRGVKIKNPPFNFEIISGLSKSQYTIIS